MLFGFWESESGEHSKLFWKSSAKWLVVSCRIGIPKKWENNPSILVFFLHCLLRGLVFVFSNGHRNKRTFLHLPPPNSRKRTEEQIRSKKHPSRSLPPHSYVYFPHKFPGNLAVLRNFEKLLAKNSSRRGKKIQSELDSIVVNFGSIAAQRGFSNWGEGLMGFSEGKKKDFPAYPFSKLTSSVVSLSL